MCGPDTIKELNAIFPRLHRKPTDQTTLEYIIFAFARHPGIFCTELARQELDTTRLWGVGWASLNYIFNAEDERDEERVILFFSIMLYSSKLKSGIFLAAYRHKKCHF